MSLDLKQASKPVSSISAPTDTVQTANTERNINNDPSAPIARMKFSPTLYSKYKKVE